MTCEGGEYNIKKLVWKIDNFSVRVGVYQGLALSPSLFSLVMDEVTKNIQCEVPTMIFSDDIILVRESSGEVNV